MKESGNRNYLDFICNISELNLISKDIKNINSFLDKIVIKISEFMNSDVCSIYIYNDNEQTLILTATKGLNKKSIGKIKLKPGEGLVGLSLKELRIINTGDASRHPNYKFFPESGEKSYNSLLALPILHGKSKIGTIVVQHKKKNYFNNQDIKVLKIITSQMANVIENTKILINFKDSKNNFYANDSEFTFIKGQSGSPGLVYNKAHVFNNKRIYDYTNFSSNEGPFNLKDFHISIKKTERQLKTLQAKIKENMADIASMIFNAHLLMLKDPEFTGQIENQIKNGINPVRAVALTTQKYMDFFNSMSQSNFREKAIDVEDIGQRLIDNILSKTKSDFEYKDKIVIEKGLYPSEIVKFYSEGIGGIISIGGGVTSHVSILARSLQIPLIITDETNLLNIKQNTDILLDASHGNIFVNPTEEVLAPFLNREKSFKELTPLPKDGTFTKDGKKITLLSNINLLRDADQAATLNSEGIGLYRTEFPFIVRSNFPSEEEQVIIYRNLISKMKGKPITFRTLDVGGDKVLSYYGNDIEENPFLGMRSIRFSLKETDIFRQQIRAILRAGIDADINIMFPMISSIDEFEEAKNHYIECIEELKEEGLAYNKSVKIGIMIELPSVLEILDELAEIVDFFSIGTNDLIQYLLAVDRTNEKVSHLYLSHHPAVLRALAKTVTAAGKQNIPVSICGDMGRNIQFIDFFIGIGITTFSIEPNFLPIVHNKISQIDSEKAEKYSATLLASSRIQDIESIMNR